QNDGDSIWRLFYDTIKGGDYRSREANVYRLAQTSVNIIDQCVAQGVPFAREYGGQLANRSFGGAQVSRTFYARGQTGQQLLLGAYQSMMRQVAKGAVTLFPQREMLDVVVIDGKARGIICRNLVTGELERHVADAVCLATGGYGTALGVVYAAQEAGKRIHVFADETRPLLQGARLTAWELQARGVPVTVLCEGAAAGLLRRGGVDAVVVGADRIARNGDTANKVGTYPLALAAREHGVPFYVAAPSSTLDPACPDGEAIPVEERGAAEVLGFRDLSWAPAGVGAWNPAFDVTPAALITAIVTERGAHRPPYGESLAWAGENPVLDT
ncbi:S-methyl-5-thioribose-1-phosphate isomerase, partial [bacterium]|nr:S-methyl-5-thioribose-1-phosphate isomerase [bacterium]